MSSNSIEKVPKPRVAAASELLAASGHMSLSTLGLNPEGFPFGSFVAAAALPDGRIAMHLSSLAEHAKNLEADGRCCLCAAEAKEGAEIARVSVSGNARKVDGSSAEAKAFLAAHPSHVPLLSFGDFSFWVVEPVAVRMVGGFAAASWVSPSELVEASKALHASSAADSKA